MSNAEFQVVILALTAGNIAILGAYGLLNEGDSSSSAAGGMALAGAFFGFLLVVPQVFVLALLEAVAGEDRMAGSLKWPSAAFVLVLTFFAVGWWARREERKKLEREEERRRDGW